MDYKTKDKSEMMEYFPNYNMRQHSQKVHELFRHCLDGQDQVYAKILEKSDIEENLEYSSVIYISLITENMLAYDAGMLTDMGQDNAKSQYRPYFIEFAVDMNHITQETYRRLTAPNNIGQWFEAAFSEGLGPIDNESITVKGIVITSASPFEFRGRQICIKAGHPANKITKKIKRLYNTSRVCLKIAFRQLCVPLCGRFGPDEGGVAGYVDRIGTKYAAKWGVQMAGMNFQTRPSAIHTHTYINSLLAGYFSANDYSLSVYNVGDGNCIYIKGNDGKRILFDIGHNCNPYSKDWKDPDIKRSQQAIRHFKPHGIILSHWDMDHLIGVMFSNDSIYEVDWIAPDPNILPDCQFSVNAARIAKYLESKNILRLVDSSERNNRIYKGANISIWCGQGNVKGKRLTETNNASLIIEFDTALLPGDCEYLAFPMAMKKTAKNFMVVPHHCSAMDSSTVVTNKGASAIIPVSLRNKKRPDKDHMKDLISKGYHCQCTQSCCIVIPSIWGSYYYIR